MLEYDHLEVGQIIKAYDHEPREWVENGKYQNPQHFLIGRIIGRTWHHNAKVFEVDVIHDNTFPNGDNRIGATTYVPMGLFRDFDGRITAIHEIYTKPIES